MLQRLIFGCLLFMSPPVFADEAPVKYVFYGDSQSGEKVHRKMVEKIIAENPKFVFHTGDMVAAGKKEKLWQDFFETIQPLEAVTKIYPALGNHDEAAPQFFDHFELPGNERFYGLIDGKVAIICLDSNIAFLSGSRQYQWFEEQLKILRQEGKFIIVYFHHPPFSSVTPEDDIKDLRRLMLPLLKQYSVPLVFNGHGHSYEHLVSDGIHFVVTAGGGGKLFRKVRNLAETQMLSKIYNYCTLSIAGNTATVQAKNLSGEVFDEIVITY